MSDEDIDRAMRAGKTLTKDQAKRLTARNAARLKAARERKVREGKIRDLLKARIEAYGGEQRAVSWLGRSHAPDVLALFPLSGPLRGLMRGTHTFIETKRPGKDATEAQAREHERMRAAGCVVLMIRDEQELDAWLPPI